MLEVMQLFYQKERVDSPCISLRRCAKTSGHIPNMPLSNTWSNSNGLQERPVSLDATPPSCVCTEKLAGFPAP